MITMIKQFACTLILAAAPLITSGCEDQSEPPPPPAQEKPKVRSSDRVAISYDVAGSGELALVFVHGWCCDRTYWRRQIPQFSERYKVIAIDLGGHGDSGLNRADWTIEAFGRDVAAVVNALDLRRTILIGHDMGAPATLAAARLIRTRVVGLVGVEAYNDIDAEYNEFDTEGFVTVLKSNFPAVTAESVRAMFVADSDPVLIDKITADISSAPPDVGANAMRAFMSFDRIKALKNLNLHIRCINSDRRSTDVPAGQKHAKSFELKLMKGASHFPMLEAPQEFNKLLTETIEELKKATTISPSR
jgi:pimeloyl-ACP methyl ester carboxylesterase